jgi:hypothetical protein
MKRAVLALVEESDRSSKAHIVAAPEFVEVFERKFLVVLVFDRNPET